MVQEHPISKTTGLRVERWTGSWALIALLAGVGLFHVATIREGHDWGGDFSLYILHAGNIAQGKDYKDTGFLYNPATPDHSPRKYPPVFPALLAPVYRWQGLNFTAMKVEIILFFLLSLAVLFFWSKPYLSPGYRYVTIGLVGFNPVFWDFKDQVLSDVPFLFFVLLTMLLVRRAYDAPGSRSREAVYVVSIGLCLYLTAGTRIVGLVLIPCVLLYDLIRSRRPTGLAIGSVLVAGLLLVVQRVVLGSDGSYLAVLAHQPRHFIEATVVYLKEGSAFWGNGQSRVLRYLAYGAWTAVALTGYAGMVKKKKADLVVIFPVLYFAAVLASGIVAGIRYLLPIAPLYFVYILSGINSNRWIKTAAARRACLAALVVMAFVAYGGAYAKKDYGPIEDGIRKQSFVDVCQFLRTSTDPKVVLISGNPRVFSLFAQRTSAIYQRVDEPDTLWRNLEQMGADYLIVSKVFEGDERFLSPVVSSYGNRLEPVYGNQDFRAYRIVFSKDILSWRAAGH